VQLVCPDAWSTTGVLRSLIRAPERDELLVQAFRESGFLSCDEAIARVHWKFDVDEMEAKFRNGSGAQVLAHCRALLARHRAKEPFDWAAVLAGLRALHSSLPQLRTIELLERLYTRLYALHLRGVRVAQCWLERPRCQARACQGVVHHA
jgi:hypothetical protein